MANTIVLQSPTALDVANATGLGEFTQDQQLRQNAVDQFNQQLDEEMRQFDQRLSYGASADTAQMQQQAYLQRNQLANSNYQQGVDWQGRAGLEEMGQQGQQRAIAAQGAAQTARDMQQARMQQALGEHDAIQKALFDGDFFTSDDQYQEARKSWEQRWGPLGFDWGLPEHLANQQAQQDQMQQFATISQAFTDPSTGEALASPQEIQTWLEMGVEPKEIFKQIPARQTAADRRRATEMKGRQSETEIEKKYAEMDADDEQAQQNLEAKRQADEQKVRADLELNREKFETTRKMGLIQVYNTQNQANNEVIVEKAKAKAAWMIQQAKMAADPESKGTLGAFDESAYQLPFPNLGPPPTFENSSAPPATPPAAGGETPFAADPAQLRELISSGRVKPGDRVNTPRGVIVVK